MNSHDTDDLDLASRPPHLWKALATDLASFPGHMRRRGIQCASSGRVGRIHVGERAIAAIVRDRFDFRVEWEWRDGLWLPDCSCPAGPYCEHAYAVACVMLDRARGQAGLTEARLARLIPPSIPPPRSDETPLPAGERTLPAAFADGGEDAEDVDDAAEAPGTPAAGARPAEEELLEWAAARVATPPRSLRIVFALDGTGVRDLALTTEVRVTSVRLHDTPRSMNELLHLRTELKRKPGLLGPEETALLDIVLDTYAEDFELRYGDGVWRGISGAFARMLRRVSDSPLVTWSPSLPPDLARRGGVAPGGPVHASPVRVRMLPACVEVEGEPRLELRVVWPDGRQRSLGDVIHFDSRLEFDRRHSGLVLADGAFHEVVEQPSPELLARFRKDGTIALPRKDRERTLASLAAGFPSVRASLAPRVHRHAVRVAVALDLRADDWLQLRVLAHTAERAWRPGWPLEPGEILFEFTPDGRWERASSALPRGAGGEAQALAEVEAAGAAGAPAGEPATGADGAAAAIPNPSPEEAWLEEPDPARVAGVLEWLVATGASPGGRRGPGTGAPPAAEAATGWWVKLGARSGEALAEAWERRPRDVQWFGNARAQRLFGRAAIARPRFRVSRSGVDWFAISAEWEKEGERISDEDLARLRAASTRWVKLASGWTRRDVADAHASTAAALADLGIEPGGDEQRISLWQLAHAEPESLAALEAMGADAGAAAAIARLREEVARFRGLPPCPVPAGFRGELRPYQQQGLDFLAYTSSLGLGAVLADDMGLGKTIQALAWVQHLRERDPGAGPCLVVCPTSVMHNWEREAGRFTPGLRVLALARGAGRRALRREIPGHDLLVTNYALLRRDLEAWEETRLGAVILDEAQNIKNPDTAVARAARALASPHRLALTGTPLENRALDLWSIMSVVNPGYLGSRARFSARYDALDTPPEARARLASRLRPVMLRRLKREVATDLPDRIEERRDCEMTHGQRQLYLAELQRSRELVQVLAEGADGIRRNKISILAALTRLRQICCHPVLAGGSAALGSGKFDALFELLEPLLAEGHKVLVFSQFVECLKLLAADLRRREISYHTLTGQTTKRHEVVAAFERDPEACVFLISLRAGGTGLNLTAASYVVLFDPWWNPAVEAQAIDRTHRIGQDRTVIAYRMLMEGSIEEKIFELQERKSALVEDVLGEDGFARALDREALEFLLEDA